MENLEQKNKKKKLLITGCGRSGTLYTAEVFRSLGLDIQHERDYRPDGSTGKDGYASWFLAVDDPHPPFGPSAIGTEFDLVLHQVRHPLKVIPSMAQFILRKGIYSPQYIEKHAPQTQLAPDERLLDRREQLILQAARYWYHWNLLAEEKATETIPIEKLREHLPRLCNDLGIEFDPNALEEVSRETNARYYYVKEEPWEVSWRDIEKLDPELCEKIQELADRYGYRY